MARIIPQHVADHLLWRLAQTDVDLIAGDKVTVEARLHAMHKNQIAILQTLAAMNNLNPMPKASYRLCDEHAEQGTPEASVKRIKRVQDDFREWALEAGYEWNDAEKCWRDPEDGRQYDDEGISH
jgi:hypothetical protein